MGGGGVTHLYFWWNGLPHMREPRFPAINIINLVPTCTGEVYNLLCVCVCAIFDGASISLQLRLS